MATISYTPKGVCSRKIDIEVERNQELFEDVETVVWRDEVPEKDG